VPISQTHRTYPIEAVCKFLSVVKYTSVTDVDTDVIDSWNRDEFFFQRLSFGKWELTIPALEGGLCRIKHQSALKVF